MRCISPKARTGHGFTLVEVLIIAPIIILMITAFVGLIIAITGDVLRTKGSNDLIYNTQDALSRIDQDAQRATEFRQTSYTPTSPQGQADNAAAFDIVSQPTTYLVLRTVATDKNPLADDRQPIYTQSGSTCSITPYTVDIVYFTKVTSGITSLWRRVIQGNTADAGTPCTGTSAWQTPTCSPGYTDTAVCKGEDTLMLENINSLTVTYLDNTGNPISGLAAISTTKTVNVSIGVSKTIAGNAQAYTGSVRASFQNSNTNSGGGGGSASIGSNLVTFAYTGAAQTWVVPSGVTLIQIECWGAQGAAVPGTGGYAKGNLAVTPGQTLYIYVGQAGALASGSGQQFTSTTFNGGGRGTSSNGTEGGGSGGGASDIRTSTALSARVIVAGGGGSGYIYSGGGLNLSGGNGGGLNGGNGTDYPGYPGSAGLGGTQSAGGFRGQLTSGGSTIAFSGALGQGGDSPSNNYGSGGGGGYYGGGGGDNTAGGGGSSYIGGVTSGTTTSGLRSGNGQITITY